LASASTNVLSRFLRSPAFPGLDFVLSFSIARLSTLMTGTMSILTCKHLEPNSLSSSNPFGSSMGLPKTA
jgi:hypothetical protein